MIPVATRDDLPSRASPELENTEIEGQYCDPTSGLAFLRKAWRRLSKEESNAVSEALDGSEERQRLMTAGDKPLDLGDETQSIVPEKSTALELMEFYFDVGVVTYRLLHRQTVFGWLDTLQANIQDSLAMPHKLGEAKASIILTIFAIVILRKEKIKDISGDHTWSLTWSDQLFRKAIHLTDSETGLPRLESAQARLIQVLYLLQTSRMNQAWYVFGNAVQVIIALGLHRRSVRTWNKDSSKGHSRDYINVQCRKRTFWVAYTIDKYLGFVFGRPRHFHDDDIDQDFPDHVNDEDMTQQGPSSSEPLQDCHLDSLIFHAKLAQIIGKISREVYSIKRMRKYDRVAAARRLGEELHKWRASLPPHLGTVRPHSLMPSFRRQATALKLAYSHAVMHANRPFLLGSASGENDIPAVKDSVAECISSARVALETVDSMAGDGTLFHAFWWTPYVTFCALAVVYVWEIQLNSHADGTASHNESDLARLSDLAERCHSHLARATAADSPGRRYSVILEELRSEARLHSTPSGVESAGLSQQEATSHLADHTIHTDAPRTLGVSENTGPHVGTDPLSMNNLLEEWQTNDWLDLDSSVSSLPKRLVR
ncbi:hypothetical protein FQN54_009164 [Arachnomyces sp. PD_36]|nr:hypothetical protein FQN54_009164 [Arachnomyces sp. PD_36]